LHLESGRRSFGRGALDSSEANLERALVHALDGSDGEAAVIAVEASGLSTG